MTDETDVRHVPCTKLVSNLCDKTHYVTHYRCLQCYLTHGLELTKVHRVVSFTQRPFCLVAILQEGQRNTRTGPSSLYQNVSRSKNITICSQITVAWLVVLGRETKLF